MKQRIKISALCLLPIALALFIRYRYVTSPQYAFRSFLVALSNQNAEELKKWSTEEARLTLKQQPYRFYADMPGVSNVGTWAIWARNRIAANSTVNSRFFSVNDRDFYRMFGSGSDIIFADTSRGWKAVYVDFADQRPKSLDQAVELSAWQASEKE